MAKIVTETAPDFDLASQVSVEFDLRPQTTPPTTPAERLQATVVLFVARDDGLPGRIDRVTNDLSSLTTPQRTALLALLRSLIGQARSVRGVD